MEDPNARGAAGRSGSGGTLHRSAQLAGLPIVDSSSTRPLAPPWPIWLLLAFCGLVVLWMRGFSSYETAEQNVATVLFGGIAFLILLTWFALGSGYTRRLRWSTPAIFLACAALAAATLKIGEFNGWLVPSLRLRWSQPADRLLPAARPTASEPVADLLDVTPQDFPQFLGPHRDANVPGIALDRDWASHPPKALWRQPIGAGWSAFSLVGPFAVTMEQRGAEELVTCYRFETGELVWAQATKARHENMMGGVGPRSTPTIHQGKVVALGATGWLHCLDGSNGQVLWEKNLLEEFGIASPEADSENVTWGRAASPLVVGDLVIVPAGGPTGGPFVSLVAYEIETGREAWRGGDRQISYASPALVDLLGEPTVVIVNESSVTGHDPATGQVRWEEAWPGSSNTAATNSQCRAIDDHRLFVSKGYGEGSKLFEVSLSKSGDEQARHWETRDLWANNKAMRTKFSNVVLHDTSIYGLSDGYLECIDQNTGEQHWKKGRYGHGQTLLVGDTILVLAETGELALVEADPAGYVELGRIQALDGKTWNNLALSSPYLLIRNGEEAACYRLTLAGEESGLAVVDPDAADGDNSHGPAAPSGESER